MDICFWGASVVHWRVDWCLGSRYVSDSFIGWLSIFDFQGYLMTFGFEVLFYQWEWNIYFPNAYFHGAGQGRGASSCRGFRACSGRFRALGIYFLASFLCHVRSIRGRFLSWGSGVRFLWAGCSCGGRVAGGVGRILWGVL